MTIKMLVRPFIIMALVLMVPLIAMQFTNEVDWSPGDFLIIGVILFVAGFSYEVLLTRSTDLKYRIVSGAIVFGLLVFVWAMLAVGIERIF